MRLRHGLPCLLVASLWFGAAAAQQPSKNDRVETETPETQAATDAAPIMNRTLPLRDGQVLRYLGGDGTFEGYARRRGLTIRFYDAHDVFIGKAVRISQAATRYYAADGSYIGRRINQRLVTRSVTIDRGDGGFDPGP